MTPPNLKIYSIDIEVHVEHGGFPTPHLAEKPIVLISITDLKNDKVYCFGEKKFEKDLPDYDLQYFHCRNEENLLRSFLEWWHKNPPDVVTGWNINADYKVNLTGGFDFPYIINRCKNIFGDKDTLHKLLSPIRLVNCFKKEQDNTYVVDIAGISILDYMSLYKWYTSKNLEAYSLEVVCQHELNRGKVEHEESLKWLYHNDWDKYVEYNIEDTYLIKRLEEKLEYIRLAQQLSLLCKCPLKMYNATTNLVEGLMLTRFRRSNKCAPFFAGGTQAGYEAAHVKEPIPNKYDWLFSLDIASSYPFAIITLNMSIETLYGKILRMSEDEIVNCMQKGEFPEISISKNGNIVDISGDKLDSFNKAIKRKMFSISPNGVLFYNRPKGVYATMEREIYQKRKKLKKRKAQKAKDYEESGDPKDKQESNRLNTAQLAYKIIINAAYGVTAVPYSRYFSPHMAEAVTSVGRYSLKSGEKFTNELFNNPNSEILNIISEIEGAS